MQPETQITIEGNESILKHRMVAILSSVKCPGRLILETYDLCQRLRRDGVTVISGFHSPMEKECLRILLNSPNAVVWCLARGMIKRMPLELRRAIDESRLVVISPFDSSVRRPTTNTASRRNRVVAEMADTVVVTHATSGGKMEALCRKLLTSGKPVYTFDHPANKNLMLAGAKPVADIREPSSDMWRQSRGRN